METSLSAAQRRLIMYVPVAVAVVVGLLYPLSPDLYFFTVMEYMVIEDLQFLFYLAASLVAAFVAVRFWRDVGNRILAVLYGAGAAGLFFVAGEGGLLGTGGVRADLLLGARQEDIRAVNAQGETTLHNLNGMGHVFTLFLFALAVYGVLSPLIRMLLERRGTAPAWLGYVTLPWVTVPAFAVASSFFVALTFLTGSHHDRTPPVGEHAFLRYQEVPELLISFSVLVFLVLVLRTIRAGRRRTARTVAGAR